MNGKSVQNDNIDVKNFLLLLFLSISSVCFVFSRKILMEYFTIYEVLFISQFSFMFFVLYIFIFHINKVSLYRKIKELKRESNKKYFLNISFSIIILPILIMISLYTQKYYDLTHKFQVTTALKFIMYQIIGCILFRKQITRNYMIAIFFFTMSMIFTVV